MKHTLVNARISKFLLLEDWRLGASSTAGDLILDSASVVAQREKNYGLPASAQSYSTVYPCEPWLSGGILTEI